MSRFYQWCERAKQDIDVARYIFNNHRQFKKLNENDCSDAQDEAERGGYEPHRQCSAHPERIFKREIKEILWSHPALVREVFPCEEIWRRLSCEWVQSNYDWLHHTLYFSMSDLCQIKHTYYPNDKTPMVKSRLALDLWVGYLEAHSKRNPLSVEQFENLLDDYKKMRVDEEQSSCLRFFRRLSFWQPNAHEKLQAAANFRDKSNHRAANEGLLGRILALKPQAFNYPTEDNPQECLSQETSHLSEPSAQPS